jgi:hypothetical protein
VTGLAKTREAMRSRLKLYFAVTADQFDHFPLQKLKLTNVADSNRLAKEVEQFALLINLPRRKSSE